MMLDNMTWVVPALVVAFYYFYSVKQPNKIDTYIQNKAAKAEQPFHPTETGDDNQQKVRDVLGN